MRFSEEELGVIKGVFKNNPKLLKLLRKVFLPEYDPNAPLGQTVDLWMTVDIRGLTPDQALIRLLARNELITHVEQQLLQLNILAESKTASDSAEEIMKNSAK